MRTEVLLDTAMRDRQATNAALAARAGVSERVVFKARAGHDIKPELYICLWLALDKYEYKYDRRGRRRA